MIAGVFGKPYLDLGPFIKNKGLRVVEDEIFLGLSRSFHVIYSETFFPEAGELAPSFDSNQIELPFKIFERLSDSELETYQRLNRPRNSIIPFVLMEFLMTSFEKLFKVAR